MKKKTVKMWLSRHRFGDFMGNADSYFISKSSYFISKREPRFTSEGDLQLVGEDIGGDFCVAAFHRVTGIQLAPNTYQEIEVTFPVEAWEFNGKK